MSTDLFLVAAIIGATITALWVVIGIDVIMEWVEEVFKIKGENK